MDEEGEERVILPIVLAAAFSLVLIGELFRDKFPELFHGDGDEDGEGGMQ